ncbi:MAG: hypothetical protein ACRDUX_15030 [Mycobacterium sp.]
MTRSHWRFATSVGLLTAGLMVNFSGAVAVADSGSGSTTGADSAAPASHGSPHQTNPLGGVAKKLRATIQGATNALGPGHLPGPQSILGSTGSKTTSPIAAVPHMMAEAIRDHTPITGLSVRQTPKAPTDDPVTAPPAAAADSGTAKDGGTHALTPVTEALTSTTNQLTQAAHAVVAPAAGAVTAGVQSLVAPVAGVQTLVAPMADELATGLIAPIPDVLTSIRAILTSTADAFVPLTQVPSDLASMFGFPDVQPASGRVRADIRGPSTTLPTPLQAVRPPTGGQGAISASDGAGETATATATSMSGATSAIVGASSLNARARTAPAAAMSDGLQAFFRSYGSLVIAASLSAMVAAALPGLVAFLIPTAAGMGVGYRQAKAGIALRGPGMARFAGSGPIGIVRSGSLVALRPSAMRGGRRARTDAGSSHLAA